MTILLILLAIITFPIWGAILLLVGYSLWFALVWLVGCPIIISAKGKPIGYIRWKKFHRFT